MTEVASPAGVLLIALVGLLGSGPNGAWRDLPQDGVSARNTDRHD